LWLGVNHGGGRTLGALPRGGGEDLGVRGGPGGLGIRTQGVCGRV
jgi:hypothetical protein